MYDETQVLDSLKVQPYYSSLSYDIFIDESIDSPAYYRSVIGALNKASETDTVSFFINSGGGIVSTASSIIHAMDRCKAKITAHLVGDCCSAATMIALHADEWEISDNVTFMVHTCSFGLGNSAEKIKDHHDFIQTSNRETMFREYLGLMSEEEIERCLEGKEYWFNKVQLEERLRKFIAHKESAYNQALEESFTQQFAEEDAMVEEALAALNIPVAEREVFDSISSKLEEYFSQQDGSPCAAPKQPCHEEEETSQTIDIQSVVDKLSAIEKEQCVDVFDTQGEPFGTLFYRYDEEDELVELEFINLADELVVISKYALQDYDKPTLYRMCKKLGISAAHNTSKDNLINKIVSYFEELV